MYHGDVHVGCEVPGPVSLYFRDLACLTFTSDHYELYCYHHRAGRKKCMKFQPEQQSIAADKELRIFLLYRF